MKKNIIALVASLLLFASLAALLIIGFASPSVPLNSLVDTKIVTIVPDESEHEIGDTVVISSELHGFEDVQSVSYQWQTDDSGQWHNIYGATASTYSFRATEDSLKASYRLLVEYDD